MPRTAVPDPLLRSRSVIGLATWLRFTLDVKVNLCVGVTSLMRPIHALGLSLVLLAPTAVGLVLDNKYAGPCTGVGRWGVSIEIIHGYGDVSGWVDCTLTGMVAYCNIVGGVAPDVRDCGLQEDGEGDALCQGRIDDGMHSADFHARVTCYDPVDNRYTIDLHLPL